SIAGWPYFDNMHPSEVRPPLDRFQIYGDGTVRAFFVAGTDIGKFTVKAAYDARSINKVVHFRPACNLLSTNEMACLWESKIGRTLPRVTLSKEDLLAMAAGTYSCSLRFNVILASKSDSSYALQRTSSRRASSLR
uniref:NmrA-like domain-containing protein n=1 Tax=Aegilops tauschii subsp. strangulata TaxID=200361 RepID=A0A453IGM5_AEGTS